MKVGTRGGMKMANRTPNNGQTSNSLPARVPELTPSSSVKQNAVPTQEDSRARFYQDYRKVAEGYDKEFLKKHDEDLNTTLIFVSIPWAFYYFVLTERIGWFVFCSHLRLYHPGQPSASV